MGLLCTDMPNPVKFSKLIFKMSGKIYNQFSFDNQITNIKQPVKTLLEALSMWWQRFFFLLKITSFGWNIWFKYGFKL